MSNCQPGCNGMKKWIRIERIPRLLATVYEKAARMVIESYYGRIAEEVVRQLEKGLVLDLGTGPGYLPVEIVRRSEHIQVVGVDLNRKFIQMATANGEKTGYSDRLTFETGNAAKLRFEDATFDMVLSTGMLHALRDPIRVFREIHRVLKKGGQAWIFDPAKVASAIDKNKWEASLTVWEKLCMKFFTFIGLHRPIETYDRAQVIDLIKATSFREYRVHEEQKHLRIVLRK